MEVSPLERKIPVILGNGALFPLIISKFPFQETCFHMRTELCPVLWRVDVSPRSLASVLNSKAMEVCVKDNSWTFRSLLVLSHILILTN